MKSNHDPFRGLRPRIREVFNRDWNPIGGCPEDEYDSYITGVAKLLLKGAPDRDLIRHLDQVERVGMGLPGNKERLPKVVAALRAIDLT